MQKILDNMDDCAGCSSCAQSCVRQCIQMTPDEEGFLVPGIDTSRCTDCGLCQKACPVLHARNEIEEQDNGSAKAKPRVFAAWNLDEATRLSSSSGGISFLLAEACIKKGGTAFGASFDRDFTVKHVGISDTSELDSLRRSKYVQSDINKSYIEAKNLLKEGKQVFFTGTGCQIAGLKTYLQEDYPNLLTADLICYGVPSPRIWSLYLGDLKKRFKSEIKAVSFRDKQSDRSDKSMKIEFINGRTYIDSITRETYYIGYWKNLFNRKSCSNCRFRYPNSNADITLADFLGIQKLSCIEAAEGKGVSMVIINTLRGLDAMNSIEKSCFTQERSFEEASRGNPRLISSCPMPDIRSKFFNDLRKGLSFSKLRRKYMNRFVKRLKMYGKSILSLKFISKPIK